MIKIFYIFTFITIFFLVFCINGISYARDDSYEENVIERQYETFKSDKIYLNKLHTEYATISYEIANITDILETIEVSKSDLSKFYAIINNMNTLSKDLFKEYKPKIKNTDLLRYVTTLQNGLNTKIHVLEEVLHHFSNHYDTMLFESKALILNDTMSFIDRANKSIIESYENINKFIDEKDKFFDSNNYNELKVETKKKRYSLD